MDLSRLRQRLAALRADATAYSLDEGDRDEAYILSRDGAAWLVYYSERGIRTGLRGFESLDEAGEHLCGEIAGDALALLGRQ